MPYYNMVVNYTGSLTRRFSQYIDRWPTVSLGFISADSTNYRLKTVFSIHSWESAEAEGQLYALFYGISYNALEHSWILAPHGVLESIP